MNKLIRYFIVSLFILFSFACKSQLPKDLPKDLEMRFASSKTFPDGDPMSFFRSVSISGNQMKVELSRCQKVENVTLDERQINGLYQLFVKSDFDLIKNEETATNSEKDGFQEIYLKAGSISNKVKLGKQFSLAEKDRKHFDELWTAILDISYSSVSKCPN